MARPVVTISEVQIRRVAERAERAAAVRSYKVAQFAAETMEREVVSISAREFIPDRSGHRRKANTTKLVNSFRGVVVGARGTFPVSARLTIKPGVNEKKIAALEHGQKPHTITPTGRGLAFPGNRDGGKWSGNPRLRNAYGANDFFTPRPVNHPGADGKHMMRRARNRALQQMKQYAASLR